MCGSGQHEHLAAVGVVEVGRDVARHLEVLLLVLADRHDVRVELQDVGRHQHRVGEEPVIGLHALRDLVLVGVRALEQAHRRHRREQPRELARLGQVRLAVEHRALRVEPAREVVERHLAHEAPALARASRTLVIEW